MQYATQKSGIAFLLGVISFFSLLWIPYLGELLQESTEESLVVFAAAAILSFLIKNQKGLLLCFYFLGTLSFQCMRILPWRLNTTQTHSAQPEYSSIRIGSFNVQRTNLPSSDSLAWIENLDVAVLLEFSSAWDKIAGNQMGPRYPSDGYLGMAILSKHGCLSQNIGLVSISSLLPEKFAPWMKCTIQIHESLVDIFAFHPPAPLGIQHIKDRKAYFQAIRTAITASRNLKILAGDFNSAPWSNLMNEFQRETRLRSVYEFYPADSTYPVKRYFPFLFGLAIDNIFFSRDFLLQNFSRMSAFGSDHFSIEAELTLSRAP